MDDRNKERELKELGLQKVEAYVWQGGVPTKDSLTTMNTKSSSRGAARQELHRKKKEQMGLVQLNLTIPNAGDIRENMCRLAKRAVDTKDWEQAIGLEPCVSRLANRVESERVRNLRLPVLEERNRRLRQFYDFHTDLMAERGLRRLVLYWLGLVSSPWLKSTFTHDRPESDFEQEK
jgi:hypothetical protein